MAPLCTAEGLLVDKDMVRVTLLRVRSSGAILALLIPV